MSKIDAKALLKEADAELQEERAARVKRELKGQLSRLAHAKTIVQNIADEIGDFLETADAAPGYADTLDEVKAANKTKK